MFKYRRHACAWCLYTLLKRCSTCTNAHSAFSIRGAPGQFFLSFGRSRWCAQKYLSYLLRCMSVAVVRNCTTSHLDPARLVLDKVRSRVYIYIPNFLHIIFIYRMSTFVSTCTLRRIVTLQIQRTQSLWLLLCRLPANPVSCYSVHSAN